MIGINADIFWISVGVAFLYGAVVGSFLNVCIWRIPREESLVKPPSHCPECDTHLRARDLIPLLSFLVSGRRCRYCGAPISWRYFVVELVSALLFVTLYLRLGWSVEFFVYALFGSALIVALFVDLDHFIIPDQVIALGIVVGLLHNIWQYVSGGEWLVRPRVPGTDIIVPLPASIAGMLVCAAIFYMIAVLSAKAFKKEAMGAGDIKLAAAIGANLPLPQALLSFFIAVALGSVIGITLMILRKKGRRDYVPFGPMMVAGAIVAILYGETIVHAWLRFYGFAG